jgi:hypothetical protein
MDEPVFGTAAASAAADLVRRTGAERIVLIAGGTPSRKTEEVVTAMTASRLRRA